LQIVAVFDIFTSMSEKNNLCPCGSGKNYSDCCEPIIKGTTKAPTAESLMRARYTSYVKHEIDFIINSCEEGDGIAEIDKKATEDWSNQATWEGLKILNTEKGSETDDEGVVEFTANYTLHQMKDVHHEIAGFKKINGDWKYITGNLLTTTVKRDGRKIGRNEPCPCGSGKKYKQCCGK
jgi:SEC-C motif domain protein